MGQPGRSKKTCSVCKSSRGAVERRVQGWNKARQQLRGSRAGTEAESSAVRMKCGPSSEKQESRKTRHSQRVQTGVRRWQQSRGEAAQIHINHDSCKFNVSSHAVSSCSGCVQTMRPGRRRRSCAAASAHAAPSGGGGCISTPPCWLRARPTRHSGGWEAAKSTKARRAASLALPLSICVPASSWGSRQQRR